MSQHTADNMAAENSQHVTADATPGPMVSRGWWKPSAMLLGSDSGPIIGGSCLGLATDVDVSLKIAVRPDVEP